MPSQQNITLRAKGLYTFPNALSEVPDGALSEANNVVIDRDGIVNPRRGFKLYGDTFGTLSSRTKQLLVYQNTVLRHWGTTLDCDNGDGTFSVMKDPSGSPISITEQLAGNRIKYVEQNGNLYFTTSKGIYKISTLFGNSIPNTPVIPAGGVPALDGYATLNSQTGWFTQDSAVAYRITWDKTDNNSNDLEGPPSARIVISNSQLQLMVQDFNTLMTNLTTVANTAPTVLTGTENNNTSITSLSSTAGLSVGMTVSGTGIPTATGTITAISVANPTQITDVGHGLLTGNVILITGSNSTPSINGIHTITKIDNDNFTIPVNVTGSGNAGAWSLSNTITVINSTTAITISNAATTGISQTLTFGQYLHNTDYNSLILSLSSSAPTLYSALKALANGSSNKLDLDMGGLTFQSITLTPATTPDVPTPTSELISLQAYYDAIIDALNITPNISTHAKSFIGGGFANSTQSSTTNVIFTIPSVIDSSYSYKIYRSAIFLSTGATNISDITPDDELYLIYQNNPTAAQLSAKQINFHDIVPDSFRQNGAFLYTNANSGQGINQANTAPPLAADIATYLTSTFYANTQTLYSLNFSLLTAIGLGGGAVTVSTNSSTNTYEFVNSVAQITSITCIAGSNFTSSGPADYFDIYSANNTTHYRVWFQVGTATAPSGTGVTLVPVALTGSETSAQAAAKLQYALAAISDFVVSILSNVLTVTNQNTGPTNSPANHVANGGFSISVSTPGTGENASALQIGVSNASTPAQQIDQTARSLVRVINENANEQVYAFYLSGTSDLPGLFMLQAKTLGASVFYFTGSNNTVNDAFSPDLNPPITNSTPLITNISVANPTHVTSTAHGLSTGNIIIISGSNSSPSIDGIQTVTVLNANTFTVPVNVTIMGTAGAWILQSQAKTASNEVSPNRIYYSKTQQPDSVPIVNFQDVGPKNKKILRILPLRDSLYILSEAGIYQLSGTDPSNFQITLFDGSTQIKSFDSAVVLNNQIYFFSNQGITNVSSTGVSIISRPIENEILPLLTSLYTHFQSSTWAVSYESDRAYMLFTIMNTSDTTATVCYRFNTFTNTWTSWDISKTCGVVNTFQDLLYLGAGDINSIEQERKNFDRTDHADRQYNLTIPSGGITNGNILFLNGLFNTAVGWGFVQTQYLTISQFNRLLRMLDSDSALSLKGTYYNTFKATPGIDLYNQLASLAVALDSDTGLASHGYVTLVAGYTDTFPSTQSAFNAVTAALRADLNTVVKNYITSTGTVDYEAAVTKVTIIPKPGLPAYITLDIPVPFVAGAVLQYMPIVSSVTWAPHHFGDASLLKHVAESTILFQNTSFSQATALYYSDLSPGADPVPINEYGKNTFGNNVFGNNYFGGEGPSIPFRTLIPRDKQRCRYISGKFEHNFTRENYSIYGISYTFSPMSSRAYR